jgi:hypothetical protein
MKTLREYIDQLDEISRRDFLKGAGAAAVAGAGGYVAGRASNSQQKSLPRDPQIYFLLGYLAASGTHPFRSFNDELLAIDEKISPLWNEATVEIESNPDQSLKAAYIKGWNLGMDSSRHLKPETINSNYNTDAMRKAEANMHARRIKPYYEKLQTLLKSTNEEMDEAASPDAVKRIEQLIQYK